MWIDEQGVAHTVSLPDAAEVMTDGFRKDLDALVASQRSEVEDVLEIAEAQIFEGDLSLLAEPEGDAPFEGTPPPVGLLEGSVNTANDLSVVLARVELRWRLDAVLALNDYID